VPAAALPAANSQPRDQPQDLGSGPSWNGQRRRYLRQTRPGMTGGVRAARKIGASGVVSPSLIWASLRQAVVLAQ